MVHSFGLDDITRNLNNGLLYLHPSADGSMESQDDFISVPGSGNGSGPIVRKWYLAFCAILDCQ